MTDEQQTLVDDCIARESRLTDWERGFVDSINAQGRPRTERDWPGASCKRSHLHDVAIDRVDAPHA